MNPVREALEKLASHGSADQIRDHLVESGITGQRGRASRCVVARYLVAQGCGRTGLVLVGVSRDGEGDAIAWEEPPSSACRDVAELPDAVGELALRFDLGYYPELVGGDL